MPLFHEGALKKNEIEIGVENGDLDRDFWKPRKRAPLGAGSLLLYHHLLTFAASNYSALLYNLSKTANLYYLS